MLAQLNLPRTETWILASAEGMEEETRVERILRDLKLCESGNDPDAKNEVDLDGTPSYGVLQFKPSTLYEEGRRYNILPNIEEDEIMNVMFDGDLQEKVARRMIEDRGRNESFWMQQFPGCARKYRFWEYE